MKKEVMGERQKEQSRATMRKGISRSWGNSRKRLSINIDKELLRWVMVRK